MKTSLKHISFILLAFLIISCQKDELPNLDSNLIQRAKSWYEQNHNIEMNKNPNFTGTPDWDNYIKIENEIYFPLIFKTKSTFSKRQVKNTKNEIHTKPYFVLEDKTNGFEESLKVFLSNNRQELKSIEPKTELSYLNYTYNYSSGMSTESVTFYNVKKDLINPNIINVGEEQEQNLQVALKGCTTYYVFETAHYSDGSSESQYLYSFDACTGGGSGSGDGNSGGGGGNTGGGIGGEDTPNPILGDNGPVQSLIFSDCSSFEYAKIFGQNVAATTNITEEVYADHKVPGGIIYREVKLKIDIATFTAPSGMPVGVAANLTARALDVAKIATQAWFLANTNARPSAVKSRWEYNLKKAMGSFLGTITMGKNVYDIRSPAPYLVTLNPLTDCR